MTLAERLESTQSSHEKMIEGSSWLTAGSMLSRLMGALYIIPWGAMMGANRDSANALFAVGYSIYALFIQLSTAGFPAAISKLVANYNSKKEYKTAWELFVKSLWFMIGAGIIFGMIMYAIAPTVAAWSPETNVEYGVKVIRSLVPAVMIIPAMSLVRGFYQGYNDMAPSAISQLLEQFVRIIYMIVMTFIIMKMLSGDYSTAVAHSTFAAVVGAVVSMMYLVYKLWRDKPGLDRLMEKDKNPHKISSFSLFSELICESIPFVIITSGIQFASLIDMFSYSQLRSLFESSNAFSNITADMIKTEYAIFSFNANKIIMIIISLAVSIAATALPLLASHFVAEDHEEVKLIIRKNTGLYAFIMFPAAIGMAIVAEPMYNIFYSSDPIGTHALVVSCIMSVVLGAYTVFSAMLQAVQQNNEAIKALMIGLLAKVLWQPICIYYFAVSGPLWSTTFGFLVASYYLVYRLKQVTDFEIVATMKDLANISAITVGMFVTSYAALKLVSLVLNVERKLPALLAVLIVAIVGGMTYTGLALKTKLADEMLGNKVDRIRHKLKLNKGMNKHEN